MGYFSELLITAEEREEYYNNPDSHVDCSYPSPVLQMRWRLEELSNCLEEYIFWENLASVQQGRPLKNWEKVYADWPEYLTDKPTDLIYFPRWFFSYNSPTAIEDLLSAIAGIQRKLFRDGYNADAEKEQAQKSDSSIHPLEGQISMSMAA